MSSGAGPGRLGLAAAAVDASPRPGSVRAGLLVRGRVVGAAASTVAEESLSSLGSRTRTRSVLAVSVALVGPVALVALAAVGPSEARGCLVRSVARPPFSASSPLAGWPPLRRPRVALLPLAGRILARKLGVLSGRPVLGMRVG